MSRLRFFRAGGLAQMRIESAADIAAVAALDKKLWVALACPVKGLELESATLSLIDTDKDGRIRVPEIVAAIKFLQTRLASLEGCAQSKDGLLAGDCATTPEGQVLAQALSEAKRVLGNDMAGPLMIAAAEEALSRLTAAPLNGDGILVPESAPEGELRQLIGEIISLFTTPDRSSTKGCSAKDVESFFKALADYQAWEAAAPAPRAADSAKAAAAIAKIQVKMDDYFIRCELAAFDQRAVASLGVDEAELKSLSPLALTSSAEAILKLPLAAVNAQAIFDLKAVNPAWSTAIADFARLLLNPGDSTLTRAQWLAIKDEFAPYHAWLAARPATDCSALPAERRQTLLQTGPAALDAIFAADLAIAPRYEALTDLLKTLRLQRDIKRLLNNFVSFTEFYSPGCPAIFRAGTLHLDSRACDLTMQVNDAGRHTNLAPLAKGYLVYADCTRPGSDKLSIVALFGAGDGDNLTVGRNGIFYDRQGRDYDATVTKIIDNPISIRQAFWAPYKKLIRLIEEQIAKRAADADKAADAKIAAAASTVASADKAAAQPPPPAPKIDLATLALIGTVMTGIATVIGGLLQALFGLGMLLPLGIVGIMLGISAPSMLIAALKLRQRNIGPLLDANGWAINSRVKVTFPVGTSLTGQAQLPKDAEVSPNDPYAEARPLWPRLLGWVMTLAIALAITIGGTWMSYHMGILPESQTAHFYFFGVPKHLETAKEKAKAHYAEAAKNKADADADVLGAQKARDAAQAALDAAQAKGDVEIRLAKQDVDRAENQLKRSRDQRQRLTRTYEKAQDAYIKAEEALLKIEEALLKTESP